MTYDRLILYGQLRKCATNLALTHRACVIYSLFSIYNGVTTTSLNARLTTCAVCSIKFALNKNQQLNSNGRDVGKYGRREIHFYFTQLFQAYCLRSVIPETA